MELSNNFSDLVISNTCAKYWPYTPCIYCTVTNINLDGHLTSPTAPMGSIILAGCFAPDTLCGGGPITRLELYGYIPTRFIGYYNWCQNGIPNTYFLLKTRNEWKGNHSRRTMFTHAMLHTTVIGLLIKPVQLTVNFSINFPCHASHCMHVCALMAEIQQL